MAPVLPRRLSSAVVALTIDCKLFLGCRFANTKADPDDADAGKSFAQRLFVTKRKHKTLKERFIPSGFDQVSLTL
jgi:hypothetical protein